MRTTIDLPEDLFREVKTRAAQDGTTLKNLMTEFIRAGLRAQQVSAASESPHRRSPPPVAIRRNAGQGKVPPKSNREIYALLEDEEVTASRLLAKRLSKKC
jgi:hypothetical protein